MSASKPVILISPHASHRSLIAAIAADGRYDPMVFGAEPFEALMAETRQEARAEAARRAESWRQGARQARRMVVSGHDVTDKRHGQLEELVMATMPGFLNVMLAFERLVRRRPVRAVVVHNDQAPNLRALIAAAHAHDVPTVHLPHGIPLGRLAIEDFDDLVRTTMVAAQGEHTVDWYLGNPHNRPEQFAVTGRPEWDGFANRVAGDRTQAVRAAGLDPARKVVGLIGSWAHGLTTLEMEPRLQEATREFFRGVRAMGQAAPQILVRPHPGHRDLKNFGPDWHQALADEIGVAITCPDLEVETFLDACDVVAGLNSTFHAAAVLAGKVALSIAWQQPGAPQRSGYEGLAGMAHCDATGPAIGAALDRCLNDRAFLAELEAARPETIRRLNAANDGKASERVLELIDRFEPRPATIPEGGYYSRINQRLAAMVPPQALRVLEVGCGAGYLGAWLKEQDPRREVVGFEYVPEAARDARRRLDAVIEGDVETLPLPYPEGYFDVILYGDVLEHLHDPAAVLAAHRRHLAPSGEVLVCIPNVAHWSVIQEILAGQFRYTDEGLLDRTHLRFFTQASFTQTLAEAGLRAVACTPIEVPNPRAAKAIAALAEALGLDNPAAEAQSNAYQLLFRAQHAEAASAPALETFELPEAKGFNIVVRGQRRDQVEAALEAYLAAFAEHEDVGLFLLAADQVGRVQEWVLEKLEQLGQDPERIPDVSIVEGPLSPGDLPTYLRQADMVLDDATGCRVARDLGRPALELPADLAAAKRALAATGRGGSGYPLEDKATERWLVSSTEAWQEPLAAFLEAVGPQDSALLLLRSRPGQAEAAQEAILAWLAAHGHDPEALPEIRLVDPSDEELTALYRMATAWIATPDAEGRLLAQAWGLPELAAEPGAMRRALSGPSDRCSVVVVTYNSMATLDACLASVLGTLAPGDELIVVDNASQDQTPQRLQELAANDPRVRVHLSSANLGFSEGTNTGLRMATGEYLVLLNPDTVVTAGWLHRLRAACQDPGVGAAGPTSDYVAGHQKVQLHLPRAPQGEVSPLELAMVLAEAHHGRGFETKLLIGFCMMVPRRAFDRVGLLDPELFLGNDDLDLSWRLRQAGLKLVVAVDTFVHHVGQVSFGTAPKPRTRRLVQESTDVLARKLVAHYGANRVPSSQELWGMDWFKPSPGLLETGVVAPRTPRASLVILTLNQLEMTKLCIDSLLRHTDEVELVMVDNGSTDGTVAYLQDLAARHDFVRLILNPRNRGFAGGCNQGIAIARGQYVLLLNNDTVVGEGWLEGLIRAIEVPGVGVVGPRTNNIVGPQQVNGVGYDPRTLEGFEAYARQWRAQNQGKGWETNRVIGFCMLIRREVIERVGGLDTGFGTGNFEDDDYCARVRLAGYRILVTDEVFLHHFGSVTFKGQKIDYRETMDRNWRVFKAKWRFPEEMTPEKGYSFAHILTQAFDPQRHTVPLFSPVGPKAELPERRGFNLVLSEPEPARFKAAVAAYLEAFSEADDVALHVLAGAEIETAERWVRDVLEATGRDPERIADISLLPCPATPLELPDYLRAADLVLGAELTLLGAGDLGVATCTEPTAAELRSAFERSALEPAER